MLTDTHLLTLPRHGGRVLAMLLAVTMMSVTLAVPASAAPVEDTTMSLVGSPAIGEEVTVSFLDGHDPVGFDFDLWACPDTSIKPRDGGVTGECFGPNIETRTGLSTTFTLTEAQYGAMCNWLLIVNDYPNGGHSNWIGPLTGIEDCANPVAESPDDAPASTNAELSGLGLSAGALSPAFTADTTTYTASVNSATTSISLTPTAADDTATITVQDSAVTSGAASQPIDLAVGANVVTIVVTAEDGTTTSTYTVTITREAPKKSSSDRRPRPPERQLPTPVNEPGGARLAVPATGAGTVVIGERAATATVAGTSDGVSVNGAGFGLKLRPSDGNGGPAGGRSGTTLLLRDRDEVGLSAHGFAPSTSVRVWMFSEPTLLGEFTTDRAGALEAALRDLPEDAPACQHTLLVEGTLEDGEAVSIAVGVALLPDPYPFGDVAPTGAHGWAIGCLHARGITKGVSADRYDQGGPVTRGQAAALVARARGLQPGAGHGFADVAGNVHAPAIAALSEAGHLKGYADGTFRPGRPLTRGQAASLLVRAYGLKSSDGRTFTDTVTDAHGEAIAVLAAAGVVDGFGDGTFRPEARVTRGQFASMLADLIPQG